MIRSKDDTSRARPNFFIVGAPKAGTTSLDSFLRSHPDVYLSPIKEPCHFCPDIQKQTNKDFLKQKMVSIKEYLDQEVRPTIHNHFVEDRGDYERLFEGHEGQSCIGECSTFYLSSGDAPGKISEYNPSAKIVAVLRNPRSRILSHYAMDRQIGLTVHPLEKHLRDELAFGQEASWGNSRFYLGASRYDEQLKRYFAAFPANQIMILIFEELLADPHNQLLALHDFLGLDVATKNLSLPKVNASQRARFEAVNYALYHMGLKGALKKWVPRILPVSIWQMIKCIYFNGPKRNSENQLASDLEDRIELLKSQTITFLGRRPQGW